MGNEHLHHPWVCWEGQIICGSGTLLGRFELGQGDRKEGMGREKIVMKLQQRGKTWAGNLPVT